MPSNTVPPFDINAFVWAAMDFLNAHPMVFGALIGAAAVVIWKLGVLVGIEWEIRSVRAARDREVKELQQLAAQRDADRQRKRLIAAIVVRNGKVQ